MQKSCVLRNVLLLAARANDDLATFSCHVDVSSKDNCHREPNPTTTSVTVVIIELVTEIAMLVAAIFIILTRLVWQH